MRSNHAMALVVSVFALGGAGCGSDDRDNGANSSTQTRVRLANATSAATLTMNAVGVTDANITFASTPTAPGAASAYATTTAQTYTIGISGVGLTPSTQSTGLSAEVSYTLLAYARNGAANTFLLTDNVAAQSSGFASLNIANVGPDAGTLDVYLVAPSTSPNGVTPSFNGVAARNFSGAKSLTAGTYDLIVTAGGKPADVRLSLPAVSLASTDIVTLALMPTPGGGLVNGALIKQGGTMEILPTPKSRVRVVGAFPPDTDGNATIAVAVGASSIPNVTAPSVGAYRLVDGGVSAYTVSVNGVAAPSLPAASFANGGDYTILVSGSPAAPQVAVLSDNNQPSSSGYANIRLVNAAVTNGGITLSHNYLPINSDVKYGQASDYAPTSPLSDSLLQITSPVAAFPTYSATNASVLAGGVYTIFALGSTSAPVIVFSKDR
jgi:hypothetical protein